MHRLQELVRLHRMGTSSRACARLLGLSRNTEREYREALCSAGLWDGPVDALPELDVLRAAVERARPVKPPPPQQQSSIEIYRCVIAPLASQGVGAQAIYDRLRQEHSAFAGSLSAVKRMCRAVVRERGVRAEDVAIPIETEPGQEAQVDFGYVAGRLGVGLRKLTKYRAVLELLSAGTRKRVETVKNAGRAQNRSPSWVGTKLRFWPLVA
jgi:hypothetical protein